jgi:hypothetical protein
MDAAAFRTGDFFAAAFLAGFAAFGVFATVQSPNKGFEVNSLPCHGDSRL